MSRWLLFTLVLIFAAAVPGAHAGPDRLAEVDAKLRRQYPGLGHVSAADLAKRLQQSDQDILLLDTRRTGEFEMSHIPGAIHVPPRASASDILERIGDRAEGADIVVYCSVGVRSSRLADRTGEVLLAAGARSVTNLEGGIFGWHNDGRPLVNAAGPTRQVHRFNRFWGQLLRSDPPAETAQ